MTGATRTQTLEAKLVFSSQSQQAAADIAKLTTGIKEIDRAAKDAQTSMARLNSAGAGGGVYGVAGPSGMSAATAYGRSGHLASITPSMPPGTAGRGVSSAGAMAGGAAMGGSDFGFKAAMFIGAMHTATEGLANFTRAIERSATMIDPAGRRLGGGAQFGASMAGGIADMPLLGGMFKSGWQIGDFFAGTSPALIGRYPQRYVDSFSDAYRSQLSLANVGSRVEAGRATDELSRRQRRVDLSAAGSEAFMAAESGRLASTVAEFRTDPALAMAQFGQRRSEAGLLESQRAQEAAGADVRMMQWRVRTRQAGLENARGMASGAASAFAVFGGTAGRQDATARASVLTQEKMLLEDQKNLTEAIKRLEQAGLDTAAKKLELQRSTLDVRRAELASTERKIGGAIEFGMMGPMEQMSLTQSLRRLQGGNRLSNEEFQQLMAFGPTANMAREGFLSQRQNDPAINELLRLLGEDSLQSLQRKQKVQLESTFALQIQEGEAAKLAKQISDTIIPELVRQVNEELKGKLRITELERQQAAAQQP